MRLIFVFLTLVSFQAAHADLVFDANTVLASPRGPFGPHMLQGESMRVDGNLSPNGFFFKSAFRTPEAQALAREHGIYLGNLFTTNYYELTGAVLHGDPDSNHPLQYVELMAKARQASPLATKMARNWILEKYYVRTLPTSNLAKVFGLRSIADYELERAFSEYFFDVYLAGLTNEFNFLLATSLIRESPITETPSIAEARDLISNTHLRLMLKWGANDVRVSRLFELRNLVHNQMSREIIGAIEQFLSTVPEYSEEGNTELQRVRDILTEYYSVEASKVVSLARESGNRQLADAVTLLVATVKGTDPYARQLLNVSRLIADVKSDLASGGYFRYSRTKSLLLISVATQFMSKEALDMIHPNTETAQILLNCVYAEGFLIHDNWVYFRDELTAATTRLQIKNLLSDIIDVSNTTLTETMSPTLNQWVSFEPQMQGFSDSVIKSSSLSSLATFSGRIN